AAQSAMLTNVGPRLPTNIGPRGPTIDSIGPRYDSTVRGSGGNGQGGGNNSNSSNANSSSGGNSASGNTGGSKKQVVGRPRRSGVPPGNERRYFPDRVVFELNGNPSDERVTALLNRFRLERLTTLRIPLLNTTIYNARITDGSTVPVKVRAMEADTSFRNVQP